MGIHRTARIADGAALGEDVEIGPYCVIGPQVRVGDRCRLDTHTVVDGDTKIGPNCRIFPFAVIGVLPQDKKLKDTDVAGHLRIGARNVFREHVTIHGGTPHGTGTTVIGDDNMFLVGSHVGHDSRIGNQVVFTNGAMAAGHTTIDDHAVLGAMVGVHQFARVGSLAMIGAGAMLSHDAPPFSLVQGDRARLVGVNLVGLGRAGVDPTSTARIKKAYRLLFWRSGTLSERLETLRNSDLSRDPERRSTGRS